jgi:hypothetical protein
MKRTIAWKPCGGLNLASSRFRAFYPCQHLQAAGFPCEIFDQRNIDQYRLVILQKGYMQDRDLELALYLKSNGVKLVLDLCDNDFYNPRSHPVPGKTAERLSKMVQTVDFVSVATPEIGRLINKDWIVIDDFLEIPAKYSATSVASEVTKAFKEVANRGINLVWFGNNRQEPIDGSTSGIIDLQNILPTLEKLNLEIPLNLMVISNSIELFGKYIAGAQLNVQFRAWERKTFQYFFRQNDICIIPITPDPFTICKTSNRLITSLLLDVPVIADKIPSYEEFSDYVLFADWENNVRKYALNPDLRKQHSRLGRKYILENFSKEQILDQWISLFNKLWV